MENKETLQNWAIKICPLRNKQCLQQQCAWWAEEEKACAIKIIRRSYPSPQK